MLLRRSLVISFILQLIVSWTVFAGTSVESCPLSNPAYKDIRTAAAALEVEILFPAGCEDLAEKLKVANHQIATSAEGLSETNSNDPTQTSKSQRLVALSSNGIVQVSQLFQRYASHSDKCGNALLSASDYLLAFIDTVNGIAPFMMSFGGPSAIPVTLGVTLLGSAVKTFTVYFESLKREMLTSQMRQAFINNSCGYFRFNELLRSLIQNLKGQTSDLDKKVIHLQKEVDTLKALEPPTPEITPEIIALDQQLKADQSFFSTFLALFERATLTPGLACHIVKAQIESSIAHNDFPAGAIQRLDQLEKKSAAEGRTPTAHSGLIETSLQLTRPELYEPGNEDPIRCVGRARDWIQIIKELLTATDLELSYPGRRDLSKTSQGQAHQSWNESYQKAIEKFKSSESLQKFLHSLAQKGTEIDVSELLDSRDKIRRELFGNGKDYSFFGLVHKKNPAQAWLEHKWSSAELQLREYTETLPIFETGWLKQNTVIFPSRREKQFACGLAENLVFGWNTAQRHIEASRFFCDLFEQTINRAAHPYVTEYCLGNFDEKGRRASPGKLALTDLSVLQHKAKVTKIIGWMKVASCDTPRPLDENLPGSLVATVQAPSGDQLINETAQLP